jgi:phage head maturation protease
MIKTVDVWVSTYQDTWEKVLDGTLTGFSIGGKIIESDNEVNKATGKTVRFIKDYSLMELSIVDSPANELCNILSISKMNGELIFKGIATEVKAEKLLDKEKILNEAKKAKEMGASRFCMGAAWRSPTTGPRRGAAC